MRILTVLVFLFILSHRIDAADDGAGPSSAGPRAINSGTENQQSTLPPAAIRSAAIQRQLESIESELSVLRATVRDPQIPDSIRGAVIDQQEELLNRRKELEAELRVHLENLENRRSDPNAPSTSRENPAEDQVEEDPASERHRSRGKRRAFDDSATSEGNHAYGSTYIARSLPRPEEGFKDKSKGEVHKLRESQYSFLSFMFFVFGSFLICSIKTNRVTPM